MPASFDIPTTYKKSNFDFSTSTAFSSVGQTLVLQNSEDNVQKRVLNDPVAKTAKRKKITIVQEHTSVAMSDVQPKEYIIMVVIAILVSYTYAYFYYNSY